MTPALSLRWTGAALLLASALAVAGPRVHQRALPEPAWQPPALIPFTPVAARDMRGTTSKPARSRLLQGSAGSSLTLPSSAAPEAIADAFVRDRLHPAGEIAHVSTVAAGGGVRFVALEQRFAGIPVSLGRISVAVAKDGSVLSARVGELAAAAPPPLHLPRVADAAEARVAALSAFGLRKAVSGSDPMDAMEPEQVIVPLGGGSVRAWRVPFSPDGRPEHLAEILVAAADGRPLAITPLVFPGVEGARVYPRDPVQGSRWVTFPDPVLRPSVDSPMGWASALETIGNNTRVELDREADFPTDPPLTAVATGIPAVFDFAYTGDPRVDADLALANVFWAINDAHDRLRKLGFDEPSGNCQDHNLQRGGLAGDRVHALVQYGSGDGSTPVGFTGLGTAGDGGFTYMIVGVFRDEAGQLRDGALETDLLYHEMGHAASIRLIGGDAACFGGAQPQAISEGFSDFLAASFTDDPVIGAFTSGRPGRGHREFPIGGG